MKTLLEILLVGCGSFVGGAARFLVAKALPVGGAAGFPWATFAVNVAGCFLLGAVSGFAGRAGGLDPRLRLLLATGFCGGFTTFSTFLGENAAFLRSGHDTLAAIYVASSLALGLAAVVAGYKAMNWAT
ncbi:MAG: CrcB family protein [Kiritimatiellae bacterium]|nr:CrcB family protein [Kiritimatiellia bacterium]